MPKLYLIPTPIGNIEDVTFRSINILKTTDFVFAEDTRRTKKLFRHYKINVPLFSFHAHNEHSRLERYINKIKAAENVAILSDAGTPSISDIPLFLKDFQEPLRGPCKDFVWDPLSSIPMP